MRPISLLAPDAWANALHGSAEVVGGDGEGGELVGGNALSGTVRTSFLFSGSTR